MANKRASADHILSTREPLGEIALRLLRNPGAAALLARFWRNTKCGFCWNWTAATGAGGYGMFKIARGRTIQAHRFALIIKTMEAPAGMEAAHSCGNPLCCRPSHLRWATRAENEADKAHPSLAEITRLNTIAGEVA